MGREQRDLGDRQIKEWVALASTGLPSIFCCVAGPSLQCPPARLNSSGSPETMRNHLSEDGSRGNGMGKREEDVSVSFQLAAASTTAPRAGQTHLLI